MGRKRYPGEIYNKKNIFEDSLFLDESYEDYKDELKALGISSKEFLKDIINEND